MSFPRHHSDPPGALAFFDQGPEGFRLGEGIIVTHREIGAIEKILEGVFAQDAVDDDRPVILRDLEIDPHITGAVAIKLFPIPFDLAELRAFRMVLDTLEILGFDLEFIEHFELLERGELRDLGGADFVEDDLEHAGSLSQSGRFDKGGCEASTLGDRT